MPDTDDTFDWWCDYCQRGKTGYPSLPATVGVTDLGGELLCEECAAATITAVAQYDHRETSVWLYYRAEPPPPTERLDGTPAEKQAEHRFDPPVDVLTATETIEAIAEETPVTLVVPIDD